MNVYFYLILGCNVSLTCKKDDDIGFCNFDNGNSGFCEHCSDIKNGCDNAVFITQRGEQECKAVCEG